MYPSGLESESESESKSESGNVNKPLISWFFYSRQNIMEHQLGGHLSLPYGLKQSGLQMEAPLH